MKGLSLDRTLYSIRARQLRLVDLHPTHPAAPVTMNRRFSRWDVIQRPRRHQRPRAVPRGVGDRAITVAANLPRKTLRLGQIVALNKVLTLRPAKLRDWHGDIRRTDTAGRFATTRAVAMTEA